MGDTRRYDVVIVTDGRLPGGTAASVAEEVTAQHRAGYRTALVHVDSPLVARPRPFHPRLAELVEAGVLDVVVGPAPVAARLVVVRHPAVLTTPQLRLPPITADARVVIANQTPRDASGATVHYDPDEVDAIATERLGGPVLWAPIGPQVRAQLRAHAPDLALVGSDWVNIIDVDRWATPRDRPVSGRPVIGRHSRDDRDKWPATTEELLAAYPASPDVEVEILGGADHPAAVLEALPDNWTTYAFGAVAPERFLAGLDFFVYFHHPDWVEAFGRTILEAMASGAVAIVPEHFREVFGDAPVYATPTEVQPIVRELYADHDAYLARSRRGQAFVRERYGHDAHVRRVEALIGPPPAPGATAMTAGDDGDVGAVQAPQDTRPRVLFVSSNGAGVGHLMRLMAMARRASDDVVPIFLTLSQAVSVVRRNGFFVEYLPSRVFSGMPFRDWHALLRDRLDELIVTHGVHAVVFDGTWPYRGLLEAKDDHPGVRFVWSRRGMWRAGLESPALETAPRFDLILEPGELGSGFDDGATARRRHEVTRVGPLTYLDADELLDRSAARQELGLDPDRPAALVQLGAGNINDVSTVLGAVIDRLVTEPDLQVCVTQSIIADQARGHEADVIPLVGVYPLARYLHAFDFAVVASGYNSFHEMVAGGLPAIFVPNLETSADDQAGRSSYADAAGVGLEVAEPDAASLDVAVRTMMDPERRAAMVIEARRRMPPNGAGDAMAAIEALLGVGDGPSPGRAVTDLAEPPPRPASSLPPADDPATAGAEGSDARATAGSSPPVAAEPEPTPSGLAPASLARTGLVVAGRQLRPFPGWLYRQVRASTVRTIAQPRIRSGLRRAGQALPADARAAFRRLVLGWERSANASGIVSAGGIRARRLTVPAGRSLPEDEVVGGLAGALVLLPTGLDPAEHARLVERVVALQIVRRSFAPLVVTFSDDLAPYRRLGVVPEVIADRDGWERIQPGRPWHAYVRDRLARLTRTWDVDQIVVLGEVDGLPADRIAALAFQASGR